MKLDEFGEEGQQSISSHRKLRWQLGYVFGDAIHLLLVGLFLDWYFLSGFELWPSVRVLIVVLLLLATTRGHGGLMLLMALSVLIVREPASAVFVPSVPDLQFCLVALTAAAYAYWFQRIREAVSGTLAAWTSGGSAGSGDASTAYTADVHAQQVIFGPAAERAVKWLAVACISLLLAMLLLAFAPYGELTSDRLLRRSIVQGNTPLSGASLFVVVLAILIIVREMGWRQLSAAQARLWLKSTFVMEHFPDLKMILRRQLKRENNAPKEGH